MCANNGSNDIFIVDKPQDIRLIYSEKHNMVLKLVMDKELSISDIARKLNLNPGLVHYYLKELERHGLVRQVRQEIKGGVVKKYYRSIAKRILLDSPDYYEMKRLAADPEGDYLDQLLESIEYLGYHLPPENREDAKELLSRYGKRTKTLLKDIESPECDEEIPLDIPRLIVNSAAQMIFNMRSKEDPELGRIYSEFGKLFMHYE